jgi:HAD superfamily hydrolase (TIGR01509 family)
MLTWARELKQSGLRIAMLSNMPRELGEHMKVVFPWLAEFDHVTLSYEIRSAQPEPAIYWDAVNGLGLQPHEAVFLDDRSENIAGAGEIGLNAALFESAEAFSRSVRESGGLFGLRAGPVTVE